MLALLLSVLHIGGATLDVELPADLAKPVVAEVERWIETSARAVAAYYDGFPVRRVRVTVETFAGAGVRSGKAFGGDPARVYLVVGNQTDRALFDDDWKMTHELVHMGLPSLAERHHWMEEGLATWVEPIARVRIGALKAEDVWSDVMRDMPQGLPRAGDRGLDFTPTWGRTYWGGAMFWMLADIQIRERTGNKKGLEHALRAIARAGGTIGTTWPIERVISVGDGATGVPVLRELYDRMKANPAPVDLEATWKRLGLIRREGRVVFDDHAPLAGIRRAITR
jgi:hypothetical protein